MPPQNLLEQRQSDLARLDGFLIEMHSESVGNFDCLSIASFKGSRNSAMYEILEIPSRSLKTNLLMQVPVRQIHTSCDRLYFFKHVSHLVLFSLKVKVVVAAAFYLYTLYLFNLHAVFLYSLYLFWVVCHEAYLVHSKVF